MLAIWFVVVVGLFGDLRGRLCLLGFVCVVCNVVVLFDLLVGCGSLLFVFVGGLSLGVCSLLVRGWVAVYCLFYRFGGVEL